MEDSGDKRDSRFHVGETSVDRIWRSSVRDEVSLKKPSIIEGEGSVSEKLRSGGKGRRDNSVRSAEFEVKRRPRKLNALFLASNEVIRGTGHLENCAGSDGSGNPDGLNCVLPDKGSVGNGVTVVRDDKTCEVPELSSCLEGTMLIPKGPRGASRRKKSERTRMPRRAAAGLSDFFSTMEADVPSDKVVLDSVLSASALVCKKKNIAGEPKEELGYSGGKRVSVVVALESMDEKARVRFAKGNLSRKGKARSSDAEIGNRLVNGTDFMRECDKSNHGEVEENLEHNAARMLSSRFDQRCADTSNGDSCRGQCASRSARLRSRFSSLSTSAANATGRLLRPRKQDFKSLVRKRRHFYEVHAGDMDSYWALKKSIKIFCPLDHGWCFGLVKDYNPDIGMHLIKYESHDEEWIDLKKRRIKLLLFPSELTGKFDSQRVNLEVKDCVDEHLHLIAGDNSSNGLMDSEPIITFFTRLTQRLKKPPLKIARKNRSNDLDKSYKPTGSNLPGLRAKVVTTVCDVPERDSMHINKTFTERVNSSERMFSFMYSRKRSCKFKKVSENIKDSERSISSFIFERVLQDITPRIHFEKGRLKFRLQPLGLLFPSKSHSLCRELSLPHENAMMPLWPVVRMEFVSVDEFMHWRFISFEGCLVHLVAILCLILKTSHWPHTDTVKMQMPCALISFKLLGLRGLCIHPLFMSICLEQENLKWAHLDGKLSSSHSLVTRHVFSDSSPSGVKTFLGDADLVPYILKMVPFKKDDSLHTNAVGQNAYKMISPSLCAIPAVAKRSLSPCQHLKFQPESKKIHRNPEKISRIPANFSKGNHAKVNDANVPMIDDSSDQISEITLENTGTSQSLTPEMPSCSLSKVEADALSFSSDDEWKRSSQDFANSGSPIAENSVRNSLWNMNNNKFLRSRRRPRRSGSWRATWKSNFQFLGDACSPSKLDDETYFFADRMHAKKRRCIERDADPSMSDSLEKDVALKSAKSEVLCTLPLSPGYSCFSENYPMDLHQDGHSNGYKKTRTSIPYPSQARKSFCSRSKSHRRKGHSSKKKNADTTRVTRASVRSSCSYPKSFTCEANILVMEGDRGWRENGAQVVLDSDSGQRWKLFVKVSGNTKYSYKADHFIQPGTINRYTHAIFWKGGSNWLLEFTDRNQWASFKDIHEECYNRNIRAASFKNIPIPGVRLIEDGKDYIFGTSFVRGLKYHHQVKDEVDVALDPSHVVYDMDSDDEEFMSKLRQLGGEENENSISDYLFEKAIDMLEKFSYAQKSNKLSKIEIDTLLAEIGTSSVIWSIYEHWQVKRQKKGVPLVRQFQPALWEQYQKRLKEWEELKSHGANSSNGQHEKDTFEKPSMFAFCLKPRRMMVPHKSLHQRPQKKFAHQNSPAREQDRPRAIGRRINKLNTGKDNISVIMPNHGTHQHSTLPRNRYLPHCTINSSTEANGGLERIQHLTLHGSNPKKMGIFRSYRDPRKDPIYEQKITNGGSCTWNDGLPKCYSTRKSHPGSIQYSPMEIEVFKLRDASNAAHHALNMAKLKREKAQWLFRKADLALHKATVALIVADAIEASSEDLIGDG